MFVFIVLLFAIGAIVLYAIPALAAFSIIRGIARSIRRLRIGRQLRPVLQTAAEKLQLPAMTPSSLLNVRVNGHLDGYELSISQDSGPKNARRDGLRFTVTASGRLPPRMLIASRDIRLPLVFNTAPVRTFDENFDRNFEVHGRMIDVAALLDPTIRARLLLLSGDGSLVVQENTITLTTYAPMFFAPSIVRVSERLVELARDLIDDETPAAAHLLSNAISEPSSAARYQALDFLMREFSGTREADEALKIAWDSPERGIKYLAAIRRGEAGLEFLLETAEVRTEPIKLRAMAMRHYARHAPAERALPLLRRTLKLHNDELLRTAVELVGRLQDRESLPMLVTIGRREAANEELRAMIVHAVGQIGDPIGEGFLLEELYSAEMSVRLAAAQALGRSGTSASLGPLNRVVARSSRDLALAAKSAISRITMRCGAGERGQLSLADHAGMGGALSYQPEDGALSVAIKDDVA